MNIRSFSIVASLFVLLVLGACSSPRVTPVPSQVTLDISGDEFNQTQHMTRQVEVAGRGIVNVILASNPSTGYQWTADAQIADKSILQQAGHGYIEPQPNGATPPLVGAPIKETWTFTAMRQGTTTASLRYARPWQSDMGLWNLTLTVVVKAATK